MARRLNELLGLVDSISIIHCYWRDDLPDQLLDRLSPYLQYYRREMKALEFGSLTNKHILPILAVQTHVDLQNVVRTLPTHPHANLSTACSNVKHLFPGYNDESIRKSIDLALRVWLMLHTREPPETYNISSIPPIRWDYDGLSLMDFVASQFPRTNSFTPLSDSTVDDRFTAYSLHRLCRINVVWTTCLAKHLYLDLGSRTLKIYPYKICLFDHANASRTSPAGSRCQG